MSFTLEQISRHVQGTVHGDSQFLVSQLKSLEQANATDIAFVNGEKYLIQAKQSKAGVLIVPNELVAELSSQCQLLEVTSPYLAFAQLTHFFSKPISIAQGISATAQISPLAKVGQNVTIGNYVVIEDGVEIGDNSVIYPHVFIDQNVKIGKNAYIESNVSLLGAVKIGDHVRIHANTSIGTEGFGFAPYEGRWHRIAQLGGVRIGNNVRIGSNCSVDRGALDDTVIDDGVIIDNLVQIAHNVHIGKHTAIAAKCGIAGSTKIGEHCILAGACGVVGHIEITDHVQITGMTMVTKSITKAGTYSSGTGLLESMSWKRAVVGFRQLSETPINKILKQLTRLQHQVDKLEASQNTVKQLNNDWFKKY